jgi:hypothetical protein
MLPSLRTAKAHSAGPLFIADPSSTPTIVRNIDGSSPRIV